MRKGLSTAWKTWPCAADWKSATSSAWPRQAPWPHWLGTAGKPSGRWQASSRPTPLTSAPVEEIQPELFPLTEGQNLAADYASLGLTLGRHPLALLRDTLRQQRLVTAAGVARISPWAAHARRRSGDQPPAPRNSERSDVSHPGGRDRTNQRRGMARPRRTAAARAAGVTAAGGTRRAGTAGRGDASHRGAFERSDASPRQPGDALAGFSLKEEVIMRRVFVATAGSEFLWVVSGLGDRVVVV